MVRTKFSNSHQMQAAINKAPDLKKSVEMLAIVPTRDKLTLLSRKIYNVMMFYAQQQSAETQVFGIELRRVAKNIDFTSKNTEVLKEHLRQMVTNKVEWQSPTTGEGAQWGVATLIAHAELINKRGEVWMEWSYAPKIKQAIFDPDRYCKINLEEQAAMKTLAGLALYEICSRYIDNPGGLTARRPLDWWRPVLTGDPASKDHGAYLDWKIFNRDVVKKAISEINRVTNIEVEKVEHKRGRSVIELQFKVKRKSSRQQHLLNISPVNLEDIGRAISAGVPQEKAEKLLERHGEVKFNSAIKELEKRVSNKSYEPVRSPDKYLATVLDAANSEVSNKIIINNKPSAVLEKAARFALLERYREFKRFEAYSLYGESPEDVQSNYKKDFESHVVINNPALKRAWDKNGLEGRMGRSFFITYISESMWGVGWDYPTDAQLLSYSLTSVK